MSWTSDFAWKKGFEKDNRKRAPEYSDYSINNQQLGGYRSVYCFQKHECCIIVKKESVKAEHGLSLHNVMDSLDEKHIMYEIIIKTSPVQQNPWSRKGKGR